MARIVVISGDFEYSKRRHHPSLIEPICCLFALSDSRSLYLFLCFQVVRRVKGGELTWKFEYHGEGHNPQADESE